MYKNTLLLEKFLILLKHQNYLGTFENYYNLSFPVDKKSESEMWDVGPCYQYSKIHE